MRVGIKPAYIRTCYKYTHFKSRYTLMIMKQLLRSMIYEVTILNFIFDSEKCILYYTGLIFFRNDRDLCFVFI